MGSQGTNAKRTGRKTPYIFGIGAFVITMIPYFLLKAFILPSNSYSNQGLNELTGLASNIAFGFFFILGIVTGLYYFFKERKQQAERHELLDAVKSGSNSSQQ